MPDPVGRKVNVAEITPQKGKAMNVPRITIEMDAHAFEGSVTALERIAEDPETDDLAAWALLTIVSQFRGSVQS